MIWAVAYTTTPVFMRPSSLGGGRILRRTLSVRLSVRPVIVSERHVAPPSELQWHTCTFRQRAAYRTAISATQILVSFTKRRYIECTYLYLFTFREKSITKCLKWPLASSFIQTKSRFLLCHWLPRSRCVLEKENRKWTSLWQTVHGWWTTTTARYWRVV